jgi:hypothetical protein
LKLTYSFGIAVKISCFIYPSGRTVVRLLVVTPDRCPIPRRKLWVSEEM